MTKKLFSMNFTEDQDLIDKEFTLVNMDEDENGELTGKDLKVKLTEIDRDGSYVFKVKARGSNIEEFRTRSPNDGDLK